MNLTLVFGLLIGLLAGFVLTKFFFPRIVEKVMHNTITKHVPPVFFKVLNNNKQSSRGSDYYFGVDIYRNPASKVTTRYMFTERELEVAKKRARKNKDEAQPPRPC